MIPAPVMRVLATMALVCSLSLEPIRPYLPESGAAPQAELLDHSGNTSFSNRNDPFRFEEEEPGESSSIGANAAMRSIPRSDDEMPAAMTAGAVLEPPAEMVEMLACLIFQEAGGDACSDECRIDVADVALNRVADSRFPDTLYEVLTAPKQYGRWHTTGIVWPERASNPNEAAAVERAYDIARRVLSGEHGDLYGQGYVWQAEFIQGTEGFWLDGMYFAK